jgi:hypothetical protein
MNEELKLDVRSPRAGEWFQVHPDPAYRKEVVLTPDDDGTLYLVADHMVPDLQKLAPERLRYVLMFTAQNREGETFLWPVTLPVPAEHLAYQAMEEWVRYPLLQ